MPGRKYQGLMPDERRLQRRAAILEAALEVFGTTGYAGSSVKQICRAARLTERYFYESFTDRESCLAALYSEVVTRVRAATVAAMTSAGDDIDAQTRAGLQTFIGNLTEDRRLARVALIEAVGVSPAMEERRHEVLREFAEIVTAAWAATRAEPLSLEQHSAAVALVGGVNHLLVDWLMGGSPQSPAALTDVCTTLFIAARRTFDAQARATETSWPTIP
ncbi:MULTISPECIES: TetR/AcrR family transcriptional regulator [Nocardia]|uniref:TetR/AcrR family transcriptional regulator n=2 Tax=Nocardia TaxID=1817 RepID=A0A2T2YSN3_9NOCA|nr:MULTISPECIES: helix-turn-helix domain-containing protein [Nocardia]MBF6448320.1 TetR/AcrR family transcriptional regulator [Nocardia elegans]PSR58501.1 TetR/AcrR family transcriptional regulator [Nocardia nova]